jgi:repressor LexA
MIELTRRQQEIVNLIRRQIEKTGMPPTRADICEALGFKSPNAAGRTCARSKPRAPSK